jgi:predicted membrane protein
MQVWIVASTILATVLFGLVVWKNRRAASPIRSIRLDGILLLTWWIALLGVCAYGSMLGMGG